MKEDIVTYTAEEIEEMVRRGEDRTDWGRVDAMSEEERRTAIASDPDAVVLPEDWPDHVIFGLPEPKGKISLRVDADVLRWFRQQGPRYQSRMNAVLRAFMDRHRGARPDAREPEAKKRRAPARVD
jgi:uncharacterized protein (DUF4415 family)